jgi:hypothetical protein
MNGETSNQSDIWSPTDGRLREFLLRKFMKYHEYVPDPSSPKTFNEKILHKMLFDRRLILATFADKLTVRDYVEQKLGGKEHIAALHGVFAQADDLYSFDFPLRFALKANHGSGWNYINHGGSCDWPRVVGLFRRWMQRNYGLMKGEWCYAHIPPRVLCEHYLGTDGRAPVDYKFFCFSGTVRLVQADFDRHSFHKRNIYDREWNLLPFRYHHYRLKPDAQRPRNLAQMVSIAERLSEGIDFVRVDLYDLGDRVVFGELTNYPEGGEARFYPQEWDATVGSYWRLPER